MKKSLGARIIVAPTPVWVVGTYDDEGRANMMTAAWAGVCCSQPPYLYVSLRKATHTHGSILKRNAFTINIPSERHAREADYVGLISGRKEDKFAVTKLTAVKSEVVDAPIVQEFPLNIACRLAHTFELGLHTQFVGEIIDVVADEEVLNDIGLPTMESLKPLLFTPEARTYHGVGSFLGDAFSIGSETGER